MLQDVSDMFASPRRPRASVRRAEPAAESAEAAARRRRREDDFATFRRNAAEFFAEPPSDDGHERMIARHGFYFALGADQDAPESQDDDAGPKGLNPRVVEAFYGARPLPSFEQVSHERLQQDWRDPSETGAALLYAQGDDGAVSVFLYPNQTSAIKPEEDVILLDKLTETEGLTGRGLIESHWRAFRAYAEVTALEGEPAMADRLRVAWLRLACPRVIDGRLRRTAAWQVGGVALAVAIAAQFVAILG